MNGVISKMSVPHSTEFDKLVRTDLEHRDSLVLMTQEKHNLKAHYKLMQEPKRWLEHLDIVILETHRELDKVHDEIVSIKASPYYKEEFVKATAKAEDLRSQLTRQALVAEVRRGEVARVVAMSEQGETTLTTLAAAVRSHKIAKGGVGDEADERLWLTLQGEWGFQ